MKANENLRVALALLDVRHLGLRVRECPFCGRTLFVRLGSDVLSIRCVRCRASPVHTAMGTVLKTLVGNLADSKAYEMSSRGPLVEFLRREAEELVSSEYFDDVPCGAYRSGVQCQDVQRLTFGDDEFDLCTCTEVFEHVPDDAKGFAEVRRVLRPGGLFLFTVPMHARPETVERARIEGGRVVSLLEPEFHGDRLRGQRQVLVYRDYGTDVVDRLRRAGFHSASIESVTDLSGFGECCYVIVARK